MSSEQKENPGKKETEVKGVEEEGKDEVGATGEDNPESAEFLNKYFRKALNIDDDSEEKLESRLDEVSFKGIADYIKSGKCKKIVTMAGAGISTSAGIPDFRSPGTGLYDNLQKYNLPNPTAVFDLSYFHENPEPFFMLCKELYPKKAYKPTPCHYFIKLLEQKGLLHMHFTQNIDTLERQTGLSDELLVEAHGSFNMGHCLKCCESYTKDWMQERVFSEDPVLKCTKEDCGGVVKPDIVFFGESLPNTFVSNMGKPKECDLLIIMGTSLVVQPFASLCNKVKGDTPRLYINLEATSGPVDPFMMLFGGGSSFNFEGEDNIRDVFKQGTCDDGCQALADLLGWGEELKEMVKKGHAKIDKENAGPDQKKDGKSAVPDQKKNGKSAVPDQKKNGKSAVPDQKKDSKSAGPDKKKDGKSKV